MPGNPIKGVVAGVKLAKVNAQVKGRAVTAKDVAQGIKVGLTKPKQTVKALKQVKDVKEMRKEVDRRLNDPAVQARLKSLNDSMKKK
jgi:hypothetical protein